MKNTVEPLFYMAPLDLGPQPVELITPLIIAHERELAN
uniref:Uncharacterized protein n=1 Tax=Arundo donax TaxID=35708 RepID=A0A0A9DR49_ARUDO